MLYSKNVFTKRLVLKTSSISGKILLKILNLTRPQKFNDSNFNAISELLYGACRSEPSYKNIFKCKF